MEEGDVLTRCLALQRRTKTYYTRVETSIRAAKLIAKLTKAVPPKMCTPAAIDRYLRQLDARFVNF